MGFVAEQGTVAVASPLTIHTVEPVTLVALSPVEVDPALEVLAVRAVFFGRDDRSPGGYRMTNGAPLITCFAKWPPNGYGASYPVADLRLAPGDPVALLVYARSTSIGVTRMRGYQLTYRTADGRTHTARGDTPEVELDLRDKAGLAGASARCNPRSGAQWGQREPGYPG